MKGGDRLKSPTCQQCKCFTSKWVRRKSAKYMVGWCEVAQRVTKSSMTACVLAIQQRWIEGENDEES